MLKRYRKQFIRLNMCLIGVVLILILILVGIYMYHDYYDELKNTMSEIVKPLSTSTLSDSSVTKSPQEENMDSSKRIPGKNSKPENKPEPPKKENISRNEKTLNISANDRKEINTVFYTKINGEISVLSDELIFDEDIITDAVSVIIDQAENFGILQEYNMIYYCSGGNEVYKIAIASTSYLRESMMRLELILTGIFIVSMVLFYFISRKISLLAIKPLEDAMTREKQFVTDASHDLKTPLTVILANSNILQSNPQSLVLEQMKWVDSTIVAAHNMQTMVNNMLTLSHVESSESAIEIEKINISDIVEKAILQMESVAYDNEIELISEIEPNVHIRANHEYALHIVISLIENALKYEPKNGSVLVRLYSKKGHTILSVSNPNAVISAGDLPHIFERFYRADKTRETAPGHGLGLAIIKRMTESMGGTINVTSNKNVGTEFTVSFKLK